MRRLEGLPVMVGWAVTVTPADIELLQYSTACAVTTWPAVSAVRPDTVHAPLTTVVVLTTEPFTITSIIAPLVPKVPPTDVLPSQIGEFTVGEEVAPSPVHVMITWPSADGRIAASSGGAHHAPVAIAARI